MMDFDVIIDKVRMDYTSAINEYGEFHSPHEGYAILKEELDELWEAIKLKPWDKTRPRKMEHEARQLAAMAICFIRYFGERDKST